MAKTDEPVVAPQEPTSATIDTTALQAAFEVEQAKNAALEEALEAKEVEVQDLKAQLEAAQKGAVQATPSVSANLTFNLGGKDEYEFLVAEFSYKGDVYTPAKAMKDKTLLAELVKEEVGYVKKK